MMYKTEKTIPVVEIHGYDDKSDRYATVIDGKKQWLSWIYLTSFMDKSDIVRLSGERVPFKY